MKKYVAYYRVSTKRQGESGLGLESQKAIIDYFIKNEKAQIISEYTEVRSGGSMDKRPLLREAIDHANKEDGYLIVAKADRLSRNVKEALGVYDELNERLMCCDIPNTDRFTLTIFFAVAERERFLTKIRTKGALDAKRRREGREIINGAPFHKKKIDTTKARQKSIEVRQENSALKQKNIILLVKRLRSDGFNMQKIADALNEAGYKTAKGAKFRTFQIFKILQR